MRITRDRLIKFAETAVAQRVHQNRRLVCVYLTGSLLRDEPLLGGTTDIDLIFVHDDEPPQPREVVRITDEVHLDIAHISQTVFHQPRRLRIDPWIGSYLCYDPIQLYDTQHWFEFTQASVCAQFHQPEYVMRRARPLAEEARQNWMDMTMGVQSPNQSSIRAYLKILENAANSIACLSGPPLTERRFMLRYAQCAQSIGRPGLSHGLTDLFLPASLDTTPYRQTWFEGLNASLRAACEQENCPPRLQACRHAYYERAIDVLWDEELPAALWLLINVWGRSIDQLSKDAPQRAIWDEALQALELDEEAMQERLNTLDTYLDAVEETLDMWASKYGISEG